MKMAADIRVRTEKKYKVLYNDLSDYGMGDNHEIFFLCACLGFKAGKTKPLGSNGDDRFWSKTIESYEYATYYAMMVKENDHNFSSILEDRTVLNKVEEYANAGIEILISDFLADYLDQGESAEPRIDKSVAKELPKHLLYSVYSRKD